MGRLRRRATIARKAIAQIFETAQEYGHWGEEWKTLAVETQALTRALRGLERVDEMEIGVKSLERRQQVARERLEGLLEGVETHRSGAENGPHQHNYKSHPDPQKDTVIAAKECSRGEGPEPQSRAPSQPKRQEKGMVHGIRPDELVRLMPKLKPYLQRPDATWPDIIDAADWLRHDLGVSKSLWSDACLAMGRELAAVALAIVSTKEMEHFRTTPGGYFHGMVAKAKAGELHLERTIWALHRALQPEGHPRGRGGDRCDRWSPGMARIAVMTAFPGLPERVRGFPLSGHPAGVPKKVESKRSIGHPANLAPASRAGR
jgi:replication initiation protein RepC